MARGNEFLLDEMATPAQVQNDPDQNSQRNRKPGKSWMNRWNQRRTCPAVSYFCSPWTILKTAEGAAHDPVQDKVARLGGGADAQTAQRRWSSDAASVEKNERPTQTSKHKHVDGTSKVADRRAWSASGRETISWWNRKKIPLSHTLKKKISYGSKMKCETTKTGTLKSQRLHNTRAINLSNL